MKIYIDQAPVNIHGKHLLLKKHDWDDYSYKSTFLLTYFDGTSDKYIGELKIIDKNIEEGRVNVESGIEQLNDNFCSLGQSKEYYSNLRKLSGKIEKKILTVLNDSAFDKIIYDEFYQLPQYQSSAVRFTQAEEALTFAQEIYSRNKRPKIKPCHSFPYTTKLNLSLIHI